MVDGGIGLFMRQWLLIFLFVFVQKGHAMGAADTSTRVFVISGMTEAQSEAFYSLIEEKNPRIVSSKRPQSSEETDLIVYMLDNWDAASDAPGANEFPQIFSGLEKLDETAVSYSAWATFSSGHSIRFIFYSLRDAGYPPLRCFASHLAFEADRAVGQDFKNNALVDC
ncbi:hypothetical protein [uncultured Roseobacter sp.]|uniref:hypothetical protein n=1 Tax=uncultured Roseobacter sp. TaxID=114847 RepID=UPI00262C3EAA|nr:hypothetical protein [uncultured Roseobacter sp.]